MASIGEVVAGLRQAADLLPFAELAAATEAAEEARAHLEHVTIGSLQDDVLQTLAWFEKTTEGIAELQRLLTSIQRTLVSIVNHLEGQGEPATALPTITTSAAIDTATKLLAKLPERNEANRKTSGIWVDEAGREQDQITSGRDEGYKEAVETLRRLGIGPARGELWAASHVEVKLAAKLRNTGAASVTLAVNNEPCSQGRWSCDQIVPRVLKAGQQVTVYWPGGKKTYRGKDS